MSEEVCTNKEQALPKPPASLTIWTGYLLSYAAQRFQEQFDTFMEPLKIRVRHFRILVLLGESEPLSQVVIGERLSVDRNTIVLLLDDLEALEYVIRRRDPCDRRAHCVSLTEKGKTALEQGLEQAKRTNDIVLAPLDPSEQFQLHSLLRRLFVANSERAIRSLSDGEKTTSREK
jgi:DNA-binding MarR family transcriptional regulator